MLQVYMDQKEVGAQETLAQISADLLEVYRTRFNQGLEPVFTERSDHVVGPCLEVEFPPGGKETIQLATMKLLMRSHPYIQVIQSVEDQKWIIRLDE